MSARFPVFGIVFSVAYAIIYIFAVEQNWALFTYHPATGGFGWLTVRATAGPTMFWYGWMSTAALGAALLAAFVSFLPQSLTGRLWPCLSWAVPVVVFVVFAYIMRGFFLR